MMSSLLKFLLFCSLLFGNQVLAQKQNGRDESCYGRLMGYISAQHEIEKPKGNTVYYNEVQILNIKGEKNADIPPVIDVKTFITASRMIQQSNVTTLYLDTLETFVVYPKEKVIIRAKSPKVDPELVDKIQFSTIQKAVLDSCTFNGCYTIDEDKINYTLYDFTASERLKEAKGITLINYYLNNKTNQLDKMVVSFQPSDAIKRQVYLYKKQDLNYKKVKVYPIRSYLFDASGNLLPVYRDFRYIDNFESSPQS